VQVRVLIVEDHVALADQIGEDMRDEWPLTGGFSNATNANGASVRHLSVQAEAAWSAPRGFWISPTESR
jgi:hypothetical protein